MPRVAVQLRCRLHKVFFFPFRPVGVLDWRVERLHYRRQRKLVLTCRKVAVLPDFLESPRASELSLNSCSAVGHVEPVL